MAQVSIEEKVTYFGCYGIWKVIFLKTVLEISGIYDC